MLVHERQALEELVHIVAERRLRKVPVAFFRHFVEVALHEFEHEEELVVLANHFLQFDDVRMIQLLQGLHAHDATKRARGNE